MFNKILILISMLVATSQAIATTLHYADLTFWESPIQVIRPVGLLSEKVSQTKVHYALSYDEDGRLTGIAFKNGDNFKAFEGFAGKLNINAPITKIEYVDNKEIHTFYNEKNEQISGWGVWSVVYHKDNFNRRISLSFYNADNQPIENSWGLKNYYWDHSMEQSLRHG